MNKKYASRALAAFIVLAAAAWLLPTFGPGEVVVTLELDGVAGNLDAHGLETLAASRDWKISGTYAPRIGIPGLTAHWSSCSLLSLPCLVDEEEVVRLEPQQIRRDGNRLHFSLPRYARARLFEILALSIRPPAAPGSSNGYAAEVDFPLAGTHAASVSAPLVFEGAGHEIGGRMAMTGGRFSADDPCALTGYCEQPIGSGNYRFPPKSRFFKFSDPSVLSGEGVSLSAPYPQELRAAKHLYRATMKSTLVDGHAIDVIDIASIVERQACFSNSLDYSIILVDGAAVAYAHAWPNGDAASCRSRTRAMSFDDLGHPISASGTSNDEIDGGSNITSRDWSLHCTRTEQADMARCNAPAPTADDVLAVQADARRVRSWFNSAVAAKPR